MKRTITLKDLRKQAGMTQAELAKWTWTHPHQISNYEQGKHRPEAEWLSRAAPVLGVAMDELFRITRR